MMSCPSVIILHGTMGSPDGNWFPWMKAQLEEKGCAVFVPAFPTPEGQTFKNWKIVFDDVVVQCDPANTILIGHSLAPAFLLRMVEESLVSFKALCMVAPFVKTLGVGEDYDVPNSDFVDRDFDWGMIKKNVQHISCFAGDDDPYVPLEMPKEIAWNLGSSLHVVEGGGHLNAEFGYTEFPELLAEIEKLGLAD